MTSSECVSPLRHSSPIPLSLSSNLAYGAIAVPRTSAENAPAEESGRFFNVDLASSLDGFDAEGLERWHSLDTVLATGHQGIGLDGNPEADEGLPAEQIPIEECQPVTNTPGMPFQRWVSNLRRRAHRRQDLVRISSCNSIHAVQENTPVYRSWHHRKSSTGSSAAFVTGVRSASVSLSSVNELPRSRRRGLRHPQRYSSTGMSTRTSISARRSSVDSSSADRRSMPLDPAVTERSLQRRRVMEELINTEEGYIGDVRFLMNVGRHLCSCFAT